MKLLDRSVLLGVSVWLWVGFGTAIAGESKSAIIVTAREASWAEDLAAREVRRYIYLRTGELLPIAAQEPGALPSKKDTIIVVRKERSLLQKMQPVGDAASLGPQRYLLKTFAHPDENSKGKKNVLAVVGGDDAGTLYAAYRFAEILGIRFYLHGDVIPDEQVPWRLPLVDESSEPLFALRGIQPFHDFPEGPDWWDRDDYLAIIGQLPKMRMNFIGLHTYPEDRPNAEPTVWIGRPEDIGEKGAVKHSYPSSYQNSLRGNWGYASTKTSDYIFGSGLLFERDDFGPDVIKGFIPQPVATEGCNEVFDRTAAMLRDAFVFAHHLGVKTCVGTETRLIVPKAVKQRLKDSGVNPVDLSTVQQLYAGIFRRAAAAYPLDYYWFWTPEGWTWSGTREEEVKATMNDLSAAIAAHKHVQPPFALATCGWVLGPQQDRAMFDKELPKEIAVSCINREVGKTPVEPGFADVHGRSKWAIPWMEDDPALTSPQLWVGRMRRDAADALRYGCDGLMGIHWRTRVLGPNVGALARAAWNQQPWAATYKPEPAAAPKVRQAGPIGGISAAFPNNPISGTDEPTVYQTVRYNLSAYYLSMSNGACEVTLKFCEPHYGEAGKRVFDVKLQGRTVITNLDIFGAVGKNKALDFSFQDVIITNNWLEIEFVPRVEFPSIAGITVVGNGCGAKINCGGPAYLDYAADAPSSEPPKQIYADTKDFYEDWAQHEFGPEAGASAAAIFSKIDCHLPVPSVWTDGPGGIQPDSRQWEHVKKDYDFVDEFAALRSQVCGAGNVERYDYWLNTFLYFRTIGEINCAWGEYNHAMEKAKAETNATRKAELARDMALPARIKIVGLVRALYEYLLATVSTTGELGTVANWNQHNLPALFGRPGEELAKALGHELPTDAQPNLQYHGPTRVIVPTKRTSIAPNESLKLKVLILSEAPPRAAALNWRKLGQGRFASVPLQHEARGVYWGEIPGRGQSDVEYFVKVDAERTVFFPPSAPRLNQTVVVTPTK